MNRNSLVVSAVASAIALSGVAFGASVTAGTQQFSKEYSERAVALGSPTTVAFRRNDETVASTNARFNNFELSSAVNSGDVITLTLGGTAGAQFSTTSSITLYCDSTDDENPVEAGKDITAATAPTATGFTATATANCAGAKKVYITGGALTVASLQTVGTITLAASISRAGTVIDTATAAQTGEVVQELNVVVSSSNRFNGVIDNSAGSKTFTGGDETDVATVTYTDVDVFEATDVTPATDDAVVLTLGGDFNYLDENGTTGCQSGDLTAGQGRFANAANANTAIDTGCSTVTITQTAANTFGGGATVNVTNTVSVDATGAGGDANTTLGASNWLKPQTFTGSAVIKYTAAGNAVAQTRTVSLTPGAFTGSGATVFIPYMPVGPNISQILYVTNTANVAGTLTMSAYDDSGVACDTAAFGGNIAVGARRVTNLASALAAGIAACGGAAASKKWYLTITASLPDSALEVYSAYNVGGSDRANVINSSNGRATATGMGNANSNGAN